MEKLDLQLILDKLFRKTIFLRPLPDKSFQVVDITGHRDKYLKDNIGATEIDPACIVRVRGLKRVDYIAMKHHESPMLTNMFDGQRINVKGAECKTWCPQCHKEIVMQSPDAEVIVPHERGMDEKTLGDMLNDAEAAGRLQAEKGPEADKKQNLMLLLMGASVLIGIVLFFKMKGG